MWGYGPAMGFLLSSACTLLHVSLHSKAIIIGIHICTTIGIGQADRSSVDPHGGYSPEEMGGYSPEVFFVGLNSPGSTPETAGVVLQA